MKKMIVSVACLFLLTGCFETDFNFKTTVQPDGSVLRETKIDGRGADRFLPPSGKGWEVKSYETKGGQSILEDIYHHVEAVGKFKSASEISSDYQFASTKQFEDISDEERKNFISLGIVEPFEENVYSRNNVQVVKYPGLFKSTIEYHEIFQNKGIVELLLMDVRKEVVREQAVPIPSGENKGITDVESIQVGGELLPDRTVDSIALERLKADILSKFRFRSEVTMPGKIVSSNAGTLIGNTAIWNFSIGDFSPRYSRYVLEVKSEMIEWKTIVLLVVLLVVILFGVSFFRKKTAKTSKKRSRKE